MHWRRAHRIIKAGSSEDNAGVRVCAEERRRWGGGGADHAMDWEEKEARMTSRSAWLIVAPALEERGEAK